MEGSYSRLRRKKSGSARTRSHPKTKLKSSSSLQMQAQPSEHTTSHETRIGSCEQVLDTRKPGISNYCANQMQGLPLAAGSCVQKKDADNFLLKPRDKMMQNSEDDRPKLVCNAEIQTEGSRWKCGSGDVNHGGEAAHCRLENSFSLPLLPIDAATQVGYLISKDVISLRIRIRMEPYGFSGFRKLKGCTILVLKTVYKPSSVPDDNGLKLDFQTLREVG